MDKYLMRILSILLFLLSFSVNSEELISFEFLTKLKSQESISPSQKLIIDFGLGLQIPIDFGITSKGNGGFSLPGLFLIRVYDRHDDGSYFKSGLLQNELLDIDEDGYKEILLWGVAIKTDENSERIIGEIPVVAIIKYDSKAKIFKVIKKSEEIDIYEE